MTRFVPTLGNIQFPRVGAPVDISGRDGVAASTLARLKLEIFAPLPRSCPSFLQRLFRFSFRRIGRSIRRKERRSTRLFAAIIVPGIVLLLANEFAGG